jgi:hypothetical protein
MNFSGARSSFPKHVVIKKQNSFMQSAKAQLGLTNKDPKALDISDFSRLNYLPLLILPYPAPRSIYPVARRKVNGETPCFNIRSTANNTNFHGTGFESAYCQLGLLGVWGSGFYENNDSGVHRRANPVGMINFCDPGGNKFTKLFGVELCEVNVIS